MVVAKSNPPFCAAGQLPQVVIGCGCAPAASGETLALENRCGEWREGGVKSQTGVGNSGLNVFVG